MKRPLLLLIAISILFIYIPTVNALSIDPEVQSCILVDSKTGQVLYEQNADTRLYPASVTKMMTAVIALEKGDLNQLMTASQAAVNDIGPGGMNIGIMPEEQLKLEDLLNALLVRSANETANIIAENICPTRQEFIDLMNKRAQELGAVNTNFANPCGMHNPNHYSTARDLAKIACYAMTLPKFREIACKDTYTMSPTNKHATWPPLPSTNKLLNRKSDYFTRVTGIKTGYTSQAGFNLVSSAINDDGMELIAVAMGVKTGDGEKRVANNSKELLEYGFQNFAIQSFEDANRVAKNIPVVDAVDNATLDLLTDSELKAVLPLNKNEWNIVSKEYIKPSIEAPINKGDVLGYIEYKRNDVLLGKVNLIASASVQKSVKAKVTDTAKKTVNNQLFRNIIIYTLATIVSFLALRFTLRKISRAVNAKRNENKL